MRKINVEVSGISPLLINKFVHEPSTRKKKTYVPEEEAEKKVYRNNDGKCFVPTKNFKAAMTKAGSDFTMSGRKKYKEYIKSGIFFESEEAMLEPSEYIIHEEPVNIQGAMVLSWRPKFVDWKATFAMMITDDMLDKNVVKEILEAAGAYKGVGSYRPEYGRFKVDKFEEVKL